MSARTDYPRGHGGTEEVGDTSLLNIFSIGDDGTEVAEFSVWDATSEAIERVAREDRRKNQQA